VKNCRSIYDIAENHKKRFAERVTVGTTRNCFSLASHAICCMNAPASLQREAVLAAGDVGMQEPREDPDATATTLPRSAATNLPQPAGK
jgi:hypothetical protein